MRFLLISLLSALSVVTHALPAQQVPLLRHAANNRTVSPELFSDLEELARVVDISYCVGLTGIGISKPFKCLSRCSEFPDFELVKTWNTGQLMSDSCGYIALSHSQTNPRIIVAFRGTYSIANTVVDLSTVPQEYAPYPGDPDSDTTGDDEAGTPRCNNCTVHTGFYSSWKVASSAVLPDLEAAIAAYPDYALTLVGHSLGGAVAALAGLEFVSRGWNPTVTTFGEPRLGNTALNHYLDQRFNLLDSTREVWTDSVDERQLHYRRVTHVDDPVPLLPLTEWGYRMHAGEIYISKSALTPEIQDLHHCAGDEDQQCIAGQDGSLSTESILTKRNDLRAQVKRSVDDLTEEHELEKRDIGSWVVPSRYKLWQLFFSHRDYFWRLGLCVPGGDPWDWNRRPYAPLDDEDQH
ncbi:extracellular lipase [Aureobasidium pullulans]|uniref:Extracellular lipase n=1 Tax=Aureobasidium pullulans TaxID=5580 RepID=A0A4S8Z1J4_AURPU|nr:extracellular lipase [Aureobasidium pullulans]